MKQLTLTALRATASTALGLVVAVSSVAWASGDGPVTNGPSGNCLAAADNGPGGAITSKTCGSGCTLDIGCCQTWHIVPWGGQADPYDYKFCAGSLYQCVGPTPSGNYICQDAQGRVALPPQ